MANQVDSAPNLNLPPSQHVVDVSVINSTANIRGPLEVFVKDPLVGHETLECPSFVFLVQHPSGKKVLFDLGLRKDKEGFPPLIREGMAAFDMKAEKDVAQILQEDGKLSLDEIDSIIWSHWHSDHIGDPSTFPSNVELVVGPGFKKAFLPGYPANPYGVILESDYAGRQIREIDFTDQFQHAVGHLCGLARTTPSTFILMGADGCHHCGSLRPNKHLPLPDQVSPSPFSIPPHLQGSICPGSLLKAIHPRRSSTEPYYSHLHQAYGRDVAEAEATIHKMIDFDANEDVFVVIAHDKSLLDVIDFFPKSANEWKVKGWKETGRWRFLEDFKEAVAKSNVA